MVFTNLIGIWKANNVKVSTTDSLGIDSIIYCDHELNFHKQEKNLFWVTTFFVRVYPTFYTDPIINQATGSLFDYQNGHFVKLDPTSISNISEFTLLSCNKMIVTYRVLNNDGTVHAFTANFRRSK